MFVQNTFVTAALSAGEHNRRRFRENMKRAHMEAARTLRAA
jgi:hypothetical protein